MVYEITMRGAPPDSLTARFPANTVQSVPAATILSRRDADPADVDALIERLQSVGLAPLEVHASSRSCEFRIAGRLSESTLHSMQWAARLDQRGDRPRNRRRRKGSPPPAPRSAPTPWLDSQPPPCRPRCARAPPFRTRQRASETERLPPAIRPRRRAKPRAPRKAARPCKSEKHGDDASWRSSGGHSTARARESRNRATAAS